MDDNFPCWYPVQIRFRDLDPLAHVNNAVYFTYFEEARSYYFSDTPHGLEVQQLLTLCRSRVRETGGVATTQSEPVVWTQYLGEAHPSDACSPGRGPGPLV